MMPRTPKVEYRCPLLKKNSELLVTAITSKFIIVIIEVTQLISSMYNIIDKIKQQKARATRNYWNPCSYLELAHI